MPKLPMECRRKSSNILSTMLILRALFELEQVSPNAQITEDLQTYINNCVYNDTVRKAALRILKTRSKD